ncbi:MAG: glycosyltransferase family 2 protein, partial [Blastocatellia bacterium]
MSSIFDVSSTTLSLVIPLYNEQENIPHLVDGLWRVLGDDPRFLELILVNDGSGDRTAEIAGQYAARDPRIRLLQHAHNRGLGAAIRTGLAAAEGEWVLYTDADLPFDFRLIPDLLAQARPGVMVMGRRLNRGEGGRRWVLSKGYNLLCRMVLGMRLHDVNFACKLMPCRAVRGMRLCAEGSFIDAEMLLECRRQGLDIIEVPMEYHPRTHGESTLSRLSVIRGIIVEMSA